MHRVAYLQTLPPDVQQMAQSQLPPGFVLSVLQEQSSAEILRCVVDADFIIVATTPVTEDILAAAPRLKLIQHQGVGYDNIDLKAASGHNVPVALTPEGTTVGVAEHVFLLILALYRQLRRADGGLRRGQWLQWELRSSSYEIAGKKLAILGLGRIGRAVARRARAFEVGELLYYDILQPTAREEEDLGVTFCPFPKILGGVDIVTLHLPLSQGTQGIIGWHALELMSPQAVLINTARGGLVDEQALYQALVRHKIAGAGLDVFAQEPPMPDHPLLGLDNVVVTPHIAAGTRDAFQTKMAAAFANMLRVTRGEKPLHQVGIT
jgi:phosphoglycerate dehydrogenase-like enzyme